MSTAVAYALAVFSGAAALMHQLVWTRRLVDLLGAGPDTFSKVVGAFFAGLALGAWLAGRLVPRVRRPWASVGLTEAGIAVLALFPLLLHTTLDWFWLHVVPGAAGKLLLTAALIGPPATAMGMVLPFLMRAMADTVPGGVPAVRLYAGNTLGGVAGLLVVVFLTMPALGLTGAGWCAVGLNCVVAAASFLWQLRQGRHYGSTPLPAASDTMPVLAAGPLPPGVAALGFASGLLTLAAEVVLQHQFAQVAVNSYFSSALVLCLVLLALSIGALAAPWLKSKVRDPVLAVAWAMVLATLLCVLQPVVFTQLRGGLNALSFNLTPAGFVLELLGLGAATILPVFVVMGIVLPTLIAMISAEGLQARAGALLAWNGLGGWLGTELAQGFVAPHFGLWQSMVMLGAGCAVVAILLVRMEHPARLQYWLTTAGAALALLVVFQLAGRLPQVGVQPGETLHAVRVGREGVVATVQRSSADWQMLFNNGYTLGGSRAQFNQERQALLPVLLHGEALTVGVLGVATGSTVAGAALASDVERIDAAELSPLVLDQARNFFRPFNRDIFADPRVRALAEDARILVATRTNAYDVVVGDLFLPWRTGEGRLFSEEHFENVRRSLKPDGLFCQWLPLFQLTRPQFDTIVRTFRRSFPDAFAVRGDFYVELPIIGLVGGRRMSALDWAKMDAACRKLRAAGQSRDPLVRHVEGVAMLLLGELPEPPPGPVNTLGNAWIEWDAGQNVVGLREPWFVGVPFGEFARQLAATGSAALPGPLRSAHQQGDFFLTLEMAAKLALPAQADLERQVPKRLPPAMRADSTVDWLQWPSRVKPKPGAAGW